MRQDIASQHLLTSHDPRLTGFDTLHPMRFWLSTDHAERFVGGRRYYANDQRRQMRYVSLSTSDP